MEHQLHGAERAQIQSMESPQLQIFPVLTSPMTRLMTFPTVRGTCLLLRMQLQRIQTRLVEYVFLVRKTVVSCPDETYLGRLISPCRCRGTMKFVHLSCLNSWRFTSPNAKSVYQCDQCRYRYNFNRTRYAAIVGSLYTRVRLSYYLLIFSYSVHSPYFSSQFSSLASFSNSFSM
jgi:hypothetical protein